MPLEKNISVNLKAHYPLVIRLGFVAALLFCILAFRFFPHIAAVRANTIPLNEIIAIDDIRTTVPDKRPLPPPIQQQQKSGELKPNQKVIEKIEIGKTDEDVVAKLDGSPTPLGTKDTEPEQKQPEKEIVRDTKFYVAVEIMPEAIGSVQSKVTMPEQARRDSVQGRVYILAFIDETGKVVNASVTKGIGSGCDESALRAVQQTRFTPGRKEGKPVRVQMSIAVNFAL